VGPASGFSEHTIINNTTELFVKHFNYNTHDEDNRKICKEEGSQAPQLIAASDWTQQDKTT